MFTFLGAKRRLWACVPAARAALIDPAASFSVRLPRNHVRLPQAMTGDAAEELTKSSCDPARSKACSSANMPRPITPTAWRGAASHENLASIAPELSLAKGEAHHLRAKLGS